MFQLSRKNVIIMFLASVFQSFGVYNVHALADVTEGGVLGATLLLNHWFGISPAASSLFMNGICFLLGRRVLGCSFLVYSLISISAYSVGYGIFEHFPPIWPDIASYPLVASIAGALFVGIGAGLCVRAGGAPSGDDALAMSLSHIIKIPIQWIYLISDLVVLVLSLSYIPLQRIGWSLLTVVLSGQIIGLIQPKEKGENT